MERISRLGADATIALTKLSKRIEGKHSVEAARAIETCDLLFLYLDMPHIRQLKKAGDLETLIESQGLFNRGVPVRLLIRAEYGAITPDG